MKKIALTQGKFALVDDCDYGYLNQWKWYYGSRGYAVRTSNVNKRKILMHRVILEQMGFKDFVCSDHVNRDRLDNRRCNLRPATDSQNGCNRSKQNNKSSDYKGVCWHKRVKKWYSHIQRNGKQKSLGYHDDPGEAARAYNEAALKYQGEFAVLNEV